MKIKYKVWDKQEKKYAEDIAVRSDGTFSQWMGGDCWIDPEEEERFDVQLWTGLCDKKGRELYDGDLFIVKAYPFYSDAIDDPPTYKKLNYVGEIQFIQDAEFCAWYYDLHVVSDRVRGSAVGGALSDLDPSEIEIIGNIYENPDLLEVIDETD